MSVSEIVAAISEWWHPHVVLTGGEPMIFRQMPELVTALKRNDRYITIETAGTAYLDLEADLMSISPKRSNSTPVQSPEWTERHESRRHRPDIIRRLLESYRCQFKFVIDQPEDVEDVLRYLQELTEIDHADVWLMPQAIDQPTLTEKLVWLQPLALKYGLHLSTRMQIQQFGNRRGT